MFLCFSLCFYVFLYYFYVCFMFLRCVFMLLARGPNRSHNAREHITWIALRQPLQHAAGLQPEVLTAVPVRPLC